MLAVQLAWGLASDTPLVPRKDAEYVLHSLTLLGPTALYAAFTGVLLFASSLIAGWAENWFVWHRLDSALAWNLRLRAARGHRARSASAPGGAPTSPACCQRLARWADAGHRPGRRPFFGLALEVRHVTLSTGQFAAAVGTEGWRAARGAVLVVRGRDRGHRGAQPAVSFFLAFRVALLSRDVATAGRSRIYRAIRRRLWRHPGCRSCAATKKRAALVVLRGVGRSAPSAVEHRPPDD